VVGLILWFLSGSFINKFITLNQPIENANLLVVEGWLNDSELKEATDIFNSGRYNYIVSTGVVMPHFFIMGMNGDLVFNVGDDNIPLGNHKLSVEAFSSMARGKSGIFSAWINNQKIGESETSTLPGIYTFNFNAGSKIDSVSIRFLNDDLYGKEDINFYLASISIDTLKHFVNDTMNYYRVVYQPEIQHRLAYTNDVRTKLVLRRNHIPDNKILSISTLQNSESRTAQTAKNTMHNFDSIFNMDTLRINVFSGKMHSRRTYLAYKKYSQKKGQIGIISSNFSPEINNNGWLKNIKELLGILYIAITPK
jgi:hypothetical protein